jgi:hypothetical protein
MTTMKQIKEAVELLQRAMQENPEYASGEASLQIQPDSFLLFTKHPNLSVEGDDSFEIADELKNYQH